MFRMVGNGGRMLSFPVRHVFGRNYSKGGGEKVGVNAKLVRLSDLELRLAIGLIRVHNLCDEKDRLYTQEFIARKSRTIKQQYPILSNRQVEFNLYNLFRCCKKNSCDLVSLKQLFAVVVADIQNDLLSVPGDSWQQTVFVNGFGSVTFDKPFVEKYI